MCIYNLPPLAFRLFRALGSSLAIIVFFGFVYLFIEGIGSFVGVKHISDRFSTQTCFAFFKNQDKIPIASDSVHLTFSSRKLTHLFCKWHNKCRLGAANTSVLFVSCSAFEHAVVLTPFVQ